MTTSNQWEARKGRVRVTLTPAPDLSRRCYSECDRPGVTRAILGPLGPLYRGSKPFLPSTTSCPQPQQPSGRQALRWTYPLKSPTHAVSSGPCPLQVQFKLKPEHRPTNGLDDQFDNSNPENSGNDGQHGQLDGALSRSASRPAPSLSSDFTYRLPDYELGATSVPSISQEPNPSSHTTAPQHEWNTAPMLNDFGSPLFSPSEDTNSANFTGLATHDPFSSAIGNYLGDVPQFEAGLGFQA